MGTDKPEPLILAVGHGPWLALTAAAVESQLECARLLSWGLPSSETAA